MKIQNIFRLNKEKSDLNFKQQAKGCQADQPKGQQLHSKHRRFNELS